MPLSWNRHSMLCGSLTILKWDRERIGEEKEEMHTSQMSLRYTMAPPTGRMKKFTVIAVATVMRRMEVRIKMTWFHLQTSFFSNNNTAIMIKLPKVQLHPYNSAINLSKPGLYFSQQLLSILLEAQKRLKLQVNNWVR